MASQQQQQYCCISHEFVSAASKNPSAVAVVHCASGIRTTGDPAGGRIPSSPPVHDGDERFTYADLVAAVGSLSLRIRRVLDGGDDPEGLHGSRSASSTGDPKGVPCISGTPQIVGVHISPSVEYIVAVLSILRSGEAFLPLDPLWPEERVLSVISSSRTCLVIRCPPITSLGKSPQSDAVDWIFERSGCSVLYLSAKSGIGERFVHSDLVWPCEGKIPRRFCYVMYTSGSTGKPKGICGTEIGLLNRFWWMQKFFPLCSKDVLLFKTSISFIDHLQELLSAILTCTLLVVPPLDDFKANPLCILNILKAYHISRLISVPSLMRMIFPSLEMPEWMFIRKTLKVLLLSGETLSISLWKNLHELLPNTIILNLYGSTEVSGDCTYFDCRNLPKILETEAVSTVPIGIPITNCKVELVGENHTPDEGEISVGGMCLFSGYFGEPFNGKHMKYEDTLSLFRTGDFGKRLQSGDLVFLGRKDRTIKVNGQRVALEEIETTIREHPEVSDACVTTQKSHGQISCLKAFFVKKVTCRPQGHISDTDHIEKLIASIRSWMVSKLPPAMLPGRYICTERLPVSATGKIDYTMLTSSLHAPKESRIEYANILSLEDPLKIIKEAFSNALLVQEVSDYDDFFMKGGNSISAAHVAQKLGIDMRLLYVFPTPYKLLRALLDQENLHDIISIPPISGKRARILDDTPNSPDRLTMDMQNSRLRLLEGSLQANTEERTHNHAEQISPNQPISRFEKNDVPLSSIDHVGVHSSSHDSDVAISASSHGDILFSELGIPSMCSFGRCNKFMIGSRTELGNANKAWCLTKIPRHKKGCLQERWKVFLKSCVDASPLIVYKDGSVSLFIGSHSHIFMCIDALSGFLRWEVILEGRIECSAAITGDFSQVVVGCYKGKIYFLDYITGNVSWTFQTDGEVKMQPVVDKERNLIWCGSHDHCLYALDYKKHCCVNKFSCGGSIYGSPSIDLVRNMIYAASTSGRVNGISLEQHLITSNYFKSCLPRGKRAALQKLLQLTLTYGTVLPFRMVWLYESGAPIFGSLSVVSSTGYVICCLVDGHVLALNSGGGIIWKVNIDGPIFAGPCISSALPYQVLICSRNCTVSSFDLEGGDILWQYHIGDPITSSAYVDEQSVFESEFSDPCDRLVCVCSSSGTIHVLKVNSSAKQQRARQEAVSQISMVQEFAAIDLPGDIFSSPVMIGGRVFVGCRDNHLYCLNVVP